MDQIGGLTFVSLDGTPPSELALDPLPRADDVRATVAGAFAAFFLAGAATSSPRELDRPTAPASGLHLIYVYGHAWPGAEGLQSAISTNGASRIVTAQEILVALLDAASAARTILILDCCYAARFAEALDTMSPQPRLVVFACGQDERALALNGDRATRLSLGLARKLVGRDRVVDFTRVVIDLSAELDRDGVLAGQHIDYRMNGGPVRFMRGTPVVKGKRERTVALIRNGLLGLGAIAAIAVIGATWFYWDHAYVTIDVTSLSPLASQVIIIGTDETPDANGSDVFVRKIVITNRVRFWVPAHDIIIRVQGRYHDQAERHLAFHLNLTPSFSAKAKFVGLTAPSTEAIAAHPNMAYVPATAWYHGREREARHNDKPFWIDIRPPTVDEYRPIAVKLLQSGQLKPDNSVLLTAEQRSDAVDAVGLGQVHTLNKDLGAIFGVIAQGNSNHVEAPGDIVVGLGNRPCPNCPAVMTRLEAGLYCESQGKRLPTDLEWELAVRGVDGRVYPWGNEFDERRANVAGLPKKGDPPPSLKPVDTYKDEWSPYGLIDTVGNAGDWVVNESGSYERVYMGATYRFNPEDATAFRMLPVTDDDYLVREITARCAIDASEPDGHQAFRQ